MLFLFPYPVCLKPDRKCLVEICGASEVNEYGALVE